MRKQHKKQKYSGIPFWKRFFDIFGSSVLILALSPVLLLVAVAIRLDSKGPIIYKSRRVGRDYRVFDFYKFRSMYTGADARVKELIAQSQYATQTTQTQEIKVRENFMESDALLIADFGAVQEKQWRRQKKQKQQGTFFKMQNDPRITRVGRFIRTTSLDELPQLFNVLKGDMSLVGNRPLPLYEAEQLTADGTVLRFCAPAGITGLWQVKARGKATLSEEDRMQFDVQYAQNYDVKMDLEILVKTPLAAIQEVNA